MDEFLMRAGVAIANGRNNADILAALTTFGYDAAALQQGRELLDAARALKDEQRKSYGDQYAATAALNAARAEAERVYSDHRRLAAIVFKDDADWLTALALIQPKPRSLSDWLTQARRFYANLLGNDDALAAMERLRVTRENLAAGQALIERTEALKQAQEQAKGRARKATLERDAAFAELYEWMAEFKTVARIALAHDPGLLEALQF
jgi:hypothetical protein